MKRLITKKNAFTLVELLIVIALIAILSVAILATINPIEQANKAKDAAVQNDAAEVMNAYERYYANAQKYPWMEYTDGLALDDTVFYESQQAGFGLCYADPAAVASTADAAANCNTSGVTVGKLIESDELKGAFAAKAEFTSTDQVDRLWTFKGNAAGGSIYVCYIPKAKSNRAMTGKLYCINNTGGPGTETISKIDATTCLALPSTSDAAWSTPTFDGTAAMFRCVPE